jgi:hypothetical protein
MKTGNRWWVMLLGMVVALIAFVTESPAQSNEGFIYGKIYTSNNTYVGAIRWGGEEVLWTDLFNASKIDESYTKLIPEKDKDDEWYNFNWDFNSIWTNNSATLHQFTCQFGNIKELIVGSRDNVVLKLKNGGEIKVNGQGYNDIGAKIQVTDEELGILSIDWDRISRIEFLQTPQKLSKTFGQPLFGTVEGSRREKFTGYLIWDNDERLLTDKLDGEEHGNDVSIRFSDIQSIERDGGGSTVKLNSGRELYLTGSNDVDEGNRGVIISSAETGALVKVSWEAFRRVVFTTPTHAPQTYSDFTSPKFLSGAVSRFDGDDLKGRIVFDIDEALDFELIEGKENSIEYNFPFNKVKKITPRNRDFSQVELVSGQSLLLGELRDVSSKNGGVLVFVKGKKNPVYVSWREVNQITFD